ncbi:hypothetical protein [uncultured Paracoccus sp.]|uniref:hypothetical protein n=1 Tax=uncultured Paracoccus sp. TaxID=189685 RepID=UPI00263941C6|nr:hypothetical protein [uncultured Paracoccus sp.]
MLEDAHRHRIAQAFHEAHRREYGTSTDDFPIAFVSLSIAATGKISQPPVFARRAETVPAENGSRQIWFDGEWHQAQVYTAAGLKSGYAIHGPAVVEYLDSAAGLRQDLPPRSGSRPVARSVPEYAGRHIVWTCCASGVPCLSNQGMEACA